MSTEYVGSVILYLGANEVEVTKIDVKDNTGKKPVKTMNRPRRVKGFTRGVGQYDITFTAVVPTDGTAAAGKPIPITVTVQNGNIMAYVNQAVERNSRKN